jgi:hypothetical protein
MLEEIRNIKSSKKELRKFVITIGSVLLLIGGFLFWKGRPSFQLVLIVGIGFLASGLAAPIIFKPVYWVWMVFSVILGWVMTRVILSAVFFLVFTPIGLIARMFRKQFLELRWHGTQETYWDYRPEKRDDLKSYEKQF